MHSKQQRGSSPSFSTGNFYMFEYITEHISKSKVYNMTQVSIDRLIRYSAIGSNHAPDCSLYRVFM